MPRPKSVRKNLSAGWRRLYRQRKLALDDKICRSVRLLARSLKKHTRAVVCWSGGKDSTVVLHLALQVRPDLPVIFVDTGVEFPETRDFVRHLAEAWGFSLVVGKPRRGEDFWAIGRSYGWPILGKTVASNVERAIRTGNTRPQLSALERVLTHAGAKISAKCAEYIRERPAMRAEESLGADLKILGLRADESRARVRLWVDHGDYYYVKRYFGRNRGIWKLNPIAIWTEGDIWEYHQRFCIPHCRLYDMGYRRNGCWTCAMAIRNGQLAWLRRSHPRLFRRLLTRSPMGWELMRLKILLEEKTLRPRCNLEQVRRCLRESPEAFDCLRVRVRGS